VIRRSSGCDGVQGHAGSIGGQRRRQRTKARGRRRATAELSATPARGIRWGDSGHRGASRDPGAAFGDGRRSRSRPCAGARTDEDTRRRTAGRALDPVDGCRGAGRLQQVDLLKTRICGTPVGADLVAAPARPRRAAPAARAGRIDHVQQQVGLRRLLQRGLEGLDQLVRQVADEAHRVGQRHAAPCVGQPERTRGGVQRGEQLVGRIGPALTSALNSVDLPALV
jgi:hypothetical protein